MAYIFGKLKKKKEKEKSVLKVYDAYFIRKRIIID